MEKLHLHLNFVDFDSPTKDFKKEQSSLTFLEKCVLNRYILQEYVHIQKNYDKTSTAV